jgi:GrpB-like predicted nucleotidyltransferase (UPF0157 family)
MIEIVDYRSEWPSEFLALGEDLRQAGDAHAIHHIGSTSVPGLAANDVIDIQITVPSLNSFDPTPFIALGYTLSDLVLDHCPPGESINEVELRKRMLRATGRRRHVHVREAGRFNHRYPLLCRDYLRSHPAAGAAYVEVKRQLAVRFPDDSASYYAIKDPVFDILMCGANAWAAATGSQIPKSDI